MSNRKINLIIGVSVLFLITWMIKETFMQPGIDDLKGGFKEIEHYRNENNTGPIQHVYIVTVKDTIWQELETYGNFKPHHKGGNTKVYYFIEGTNVPDQLYPGAINFDSSFNAGCIALFEKTAMGNASIKRNPF